MPVRQRFWSASSRQGRSRACTDLKPARCRDNKRFWKGCKPNSVCPALGQTGDARRFDQRLGRESFVIAAGTRNPVRRANNGAGSSEVPYLALHPMGFSVPPGLRRERWSLTPPFHPYPVHASMSRAVYFLWHCPSGCLAASLPVYILKLLLRVTRHRALRCSDFPPPPSCLGESDSPPFQNQFIIAAVRAENNSGWGLFAWLSTGSGIPSCALRRALGVNRRQPNPSRGCNRGVDRS